MTAHNIGPLNGSPSKTTTEQVFDTLYDSVVTCKLEPGTKVSEIDIAKQLNTSRQPVRDAFFRLSKLGFLNIRPQRATLISLISEKAVLDAMFIRIAIELECIRKLTDARPVGFDETFHDNLEAQKEAAERTDQMRFHALDDAFHRTLCEVSGHGHAWELIREQKAHMDRIRLLTLSGERQRIVVAEHQELIGAIKSGDRAGAEAILRTHLENIREALSKVRRDKDEYFEGGN